MKLKLKAHKKTAATDYLIKPISSFAIEDLLQIADASGYDMTSDDFTEIKYAGYDKGHHRFANLWYDDNNELWCVSSVFILLGRNGLTLEFSGASAFESAEEEEARQYFNDLKVSA